MTRVSSSEDRCLNCSAPIRGARYCGQCGQEHLREVYSLKSLLRHVIEEVFTVDSKALRSIVPLVAKPGQLTVEDRQGRRAHFVRPLRLYLAASVLFFLVLSLTASRTTIFKFGDSSGNMRPASVDEITAFADSVRAVNAAADRVTGTAADSLATEDTAWVPFSRAAVRDWPIVGGSLAGKIERVNDMGVAAFVTLTNAAINRNLPRAMFLGVPLFAAVLHLLYIRRHRYYAEHFVFVLHVQAFVFLLAAIMVAIPFEAVKPGLIVLSFLYLYTAMRRVHEQGRLRSAAKAILSFLASGFVLLCLVVTAAFFSIVTV